MLKAAIAERITKTAKEAGILPNSQMGNRKKRSTELAMRIVEDVAYTAWRRSGIASLLQLNIKGAFDIVNYIRLVSILIKKGFLIWV